MFLIGVLSSNLKAQVSTYVFSQSNGVYTPITGGTVLQNTGTTSIDDDTYPNLDIGFTFNYTDVNYTKFGISANGFIVFGTTVSSSTTPLSTGTSNNVVSAVGVDLVGRQFVTGSTTTGSNVVTVTAGSTIGMTIGDLVTGNGIATGSTITAVDATTITLSLNATSSGTGRNIRSINVGNIRYETVGSAPNRKLVIQWNKFSRFSTTAPSDFLNFQIILEETTNKISITYNFPFINSTTNITPQVGLRGAANSDFNNRSSTTSWSSTIAGTANNSNVSLTPTVFPASGLTFTWTPPACSSPSNILAAVQSTTSANITWNAASTASNGYEYFLSTSSTTPLSSETPTGSTTNTNLSLTNLNPSTSYFFWIRSNCGSGNISGWSSTVSFSTPCNPYTIPYFEGFESGYTHNVPVAGCLSQASITGTALWNANNTFTTNNRTPRSGAWNAFIPWSNEDWLFVPVNLTGGVSYTASIYARQDGATATNANFAISYGSTNTAAGMTNSIVAATGLVNGNYQLIEGIFTPATSGVYFVGFRGFINFTPNALAIDDISIIETPTCFPVTGLTNTQLSLTSASHSWIAPVNGTPLDYEWIVTTSSTPPASGTSTTDLTVTSTGLLSDVNYFLHVRTNCGNGDLSAWTTSPFTLGYCIPTSNCSLGDVIASISLNTLNNVTGNACSSGGYSNFTTNPSLTTSLLPSNAYTCVVGAASYAQSVAVWIDYNDDGVFDNATERIGFTAANSPIPVNGTASFPVVLGCNPPAGVHRMRVRSSDNSVITGVNLTPCANQSWGETEDYLITIVAPPSCPSTGIISTVSTASFTADLSFNLGCATSTSFDFEYGPVGFTPGTGTLVSNQTVTINGTTATYTLSGLQPLTAYEVRVRANCANGDVSSWSNATPVTTLDPPCAGAPDAPSASLNGITAICAGQTITVSAGGFTTGVLGISNIWEISTNNIDWTPIAGATEPIYTSGPLSAGTVYFRFSSTCANSNITTTSNTLTLTVNALPVVSVSVPNNGVICGTQTLTASGADTYSWSPSNVLSANTGTAVIYTGTISQTVNVVGTDVNGCVSLPTSQEITFTSPEAITAVVNAPVFCGVGGDASISVSSVAPYVYTFESLGTGVINAQTANTFNVTITESSDFRITGVDAVTGCSAITTATVVVYPLPTDNITSSAQAVCPGNAVTINSGLNPGNFTANCITPRTSLSIPPGDAVVLCSNGTPTTPLSAGGLDDGNWNNRPIGFNFNYFGVNQTQVMIGTNGTIIVGGGNSNQFSFTGGFPSIANPANCIAAVARDLQLSATGGNFGYGGGTVRHWTEGSAPNRRFVVQYENCATWYSTNGTDGRNSVEVVLYETLGYVEIYVIEASNPSATTGTFINDTRRKFIGLQDGTRTIGATAPNCSSPFQSNFWNGIVDEITSPLAWRFSPPSDFTVEWSTVDAQGNLTQITTGTNLFSLEVTPTATTTYDISYTNQTTGCTNSVGSSQITINVLGDVAPSGLSTISTDTVVCPGVNFTLSTDYVGSTEGLTFQWQSSTDGIDFTDITGATSASLSVSQIENTFYRLSVVSCGGTPSFSNPLEIIMDVPTNCYCTPAYTSGTSVGDLISNVEIVGTTLSNNTGTVQGGPSYTFFTGQPNFTANLLPSTTYQVNVSVGTWGDQHIRAWIDYNDDGIFSANEIIGQSVIALNQGNTGPFPPASFSIALACNPPAGPHRMRIRSVWSTNATFFQTIDPCASYGFGETEDYIITILPAPTCPSISTPSLTGSTTTTASLFWQMGCSTATNFDIEYGAPGFTPGTGTVISNVAGTPSGTDMTYVVNGLTPNSQYQFYVRANCGGGDVSAWTLPVNASTPCAPVDVADISDVITCDSYTLPAIVEVTPSNNNGLVLAYFTQPNGGGTQLTGNITTSQTIYIRGVAGACSDQEVFTVTINNSTSSTATEVACSSFTWNGTTYTTSGVYTFNTVNAVGCDSVATLNLTINQPTTATLNVNACQSFTINNQTYTTSGSYIQNLTNVTGCDSTLTINLNIGEPDVTSVTEIACDSYSWNGTTYTTSGVYTATLQNIFGCDSVVTLNLTINNSTTSSSSISTCDSYTWNGTTYTASGTYTFVTTNTAGCDSTATLILTIGNNGSTTSATTCGSFTWTNNQTYTASGIYNQTLVNAAGCDSVVTLNLTILPLPTATATDNGAGTLTSSAGASYQWINCATNAPIAGATSQTFSPQQNGSYAVTVTNSNGCSATSTCVVVDYIGLDELSRMALNVYPNPTTGEINIAVDGVTESYNVTVEDMNGRLVMNLGALINTNGTYQVNMTNLITGVYFIKLNSNGNERVVRVIKQ
jgi:hypothetical protein